MNWLLLPKIAGMILLDLILLAGLLAIPLGLSGNFIILGAALIVALISKFQMIGWLALLIMTIGVIVGEIVESFLSSLMAKKYGATGWGMSGAFLGGWGGAILGGAIGATLGTIALPIVGTLIGSFLGTAIGAILLELGRGSGKEKGIRAGAGAFVGKVMASSFKIAIGLAMVIYIVIQVH
ncbi:MAG: DUF456 domain-containing protein [Candidatus Eisenbacteria bacterium]|uniref:DUF456 domain-containing protein n=1 Tax=Eiseniibacteriota bacterium TaxID=2212470 RepID=A0A948W7X1_UNCEI|nr:DUF456 domain-containing protein [Candidatus Eisenbacteria bacterium]MBU1949563.1 DUF456 domain-containing protein [Candidatus Eisenbacteria bacterium]MBU2692096.1 DUF456 domain-containing protein [Candidatus Eisenbacteria bacterium]